MEKIVKVCDGEKDPFLCECAVPFAGNITFPVKDTIDLAYCFPKRCICKEDGDWVAIHPGKAIKEQLMHSICAGPPSIFSVLIVNS